MPTLIEVVQGLITSTTHPTLEQCSELAMANGLCPIKLKTVFGHDLGMLPDATPSQQLRTWIKRAATALHQDDMSHVPIVATVTGATEQQVIDVIEGR